jgi:hypothetical protein
MEEQSPLSIFGKECIERRREAIKRLEAESGVLAREWWRTFGSHDTPVPVDRGHHNIALALRNVGEESADKRIAAAATHLAVARWVIEQEND